MRLLAHPDPVALESELLERIGAVRAPDAVRGVLVVVPTLRLAEHVQRRVAASRKAWLGLEVLHFRALALRILDAAAEPAPRLLSGRLAEVVLRQVCRRAPDNAWSRFLRGRPGALSELMATMRDLREAGVEAPRLREAASDLPRGADLAALYAAYAKSLAQLERRGWADDAALMRAAARHATRHARRYAAVFAHGAYEWLGIHLDLLRKLDRGSEVVALVPARPGAPVSAHAEDFARRHLAGSGPGLESVERDAERGDRLAALYDEAARPAVQADRFRFRHAQGAAAEVATAVREALAAVRDGCPPHEILLTARTLEPYAAALEATFEDQALPWVSSLQTPLRRQPLVHDLLLLLRAVAEDFPRRDTAELLRSPRIRWDVLLGEATPPPGDRADTWSRNAGVIGGLEEWKRGLADWVERLHDREGDTEAERDEIARRAGRDAGHAERIGRALETLVARIEPARRRTWPGHAADLEAVLEWFRFADDTPEIDVVRGLLGEMRDLDTLAPAESVPFGEAVAWLEAAIDGSGLDLRRKDEGGIRVLEAMQARGLTFRRVFVLGMNSGVFPRPRREDPVLGDELRRRLREAGGFPLTLEGEGRREERLLLSLLVGAAGERVEVSWQRADESGRARTASLALRELARLALGEPRPERLAVEHVPSHPLHRLEALVASTGLLAPAEERVLAALRARGAEPFLDESYSELAPGLRLLRETEAFRPGDGAYDGRTGPLRREIPHYSASSLETLGRCPLQYFFKKVLRVSEFEAEASPFEIEKRELGQQVHALLHEVYDTLQRKGRFDGAAPDEVVAAAVALLEPAWARAGGEAARRRERRAPLLWSRTREEWIGAIREFVAADLDRILSEGLRPAGFEERIDREIEIGPGARLRLLARLDRRLAGDGAAVVGDYKTSGKLGDRADATQMLKGRMLQVPLYGLLAGPGARVELLGVGPAYDPQQVEAGDRRVEFDGFAKDEHRRGFLETLRVLAALVERGSFALRPDRHCDWCDYRLACRNTHPPTLEREDHAPDTADYRLLGDKTKSTKPTLAKVRAAAEKGS